MGIIGKILGNIGRRGIFVILKLEKIVKYLSVENLFINYCWVLYRELNCFLRRYGNNKYLVKWFSF